MSFVNFLNIDFDEFLECVIYSQKTELKEEKNELNWKKPFFIWNKEKNILKNLTKDDWVSFTLWESFLEVEIENELMFEKKPLRLMSEVGNELMAIGKRLNFKVRSWVRSLETLVERSFKW